jgi:hypothetical protein
MSFYDVVGLLGTATVITTFFLNQQGKLASDDTRYGIANLVGAILILISLTAAWNLSAVLVELFWAAISAWGLYRNWRAKRNSSG